MILTTKRDLQEAAMEVHKHLQDSCTSQPSTNFPWQR